MKIYRGWREVYSESKRGKDYVNPDFKFELSVTDEEIAEFMNAVNPDFKYFLAMGGDSVTVIGKNEIAKHIAIWNKKREIRILEDEIKELQS